MRRYPSAGCTTETVCNYVTAGILASETGVRPAGRWRGGSQASGREVGRRTSGELWIHEASLTDTISG